VPNAVLKNSDFGTCMLDNIFELERRSGIKLGLLQKTLLAETGSTEQILSVLTGSEVRVDIVQQRENEEVISRESVIVNNSTERVLVRAHSKIFVRNLPRRTLDHIRQRQSGIGKIISNSRLETFRKIVEVGYNQENRSVFRRYQIIFRKKVAFEIQEELTGL
jgi:chorismate-pyruvate lyase